MHGTIWQLKNNVPGRNKIFTHSETYSKIAVGVVCFRAHINIYFDDSTVGTVNGLLLPAQILPPACICVENMKGVYNYWWWEKMNTQAEKE